MTAEFRIREALNFGAPTNPCFVDGVQIPASLAALDTVIIGEAVSVRILPVDARLVLPVDFFGCLAASNAGSDWDAACH